MTSHGVTSLSIPGNSLPQYSNKAYRDDDDAVCDKSTELTVETERMSTYM